MGRRAFFAKDAMMFMLAELRACYEQHEEEEKSNIDWIYVQKWMQKRLQEKIKLVRVMSAAAHKKKIRKDLRDALDRGFKFKNGHLVSEKEAKQIMKQIMVLKP